MAARASRKDGPSGISKAEVRDVEDRSAPRTPVIYEIVRRHGEEEMARPALSLWWSGVAAGLSISFSLLAQALLEIHLPEAAWRPLVASFGYCAGFLIVVLGRQQLFTESTITAVLPVVAVPTPGNVTRLGRLWGIVFAANLAGAFCAALFLSLAPVVSAELFDGMIQVSRHLLELTWSEKFFRGIGAGFLIAAMVWIKPGAEGAQFHVITVMTYLVALAGFTHIVAGSVETFLLLINGHLGVWTMIGEFTLPILLGNVVGGTALFSVLSYAQVMKEI